MTTTSPVATRAARRPRAAVLDLLVRRPEILVAVTLLVLLVATSRGYGWGRRARLVAAVRGPSAPWPG